LRNFVFISIIFYFYINLYYNEYSIVKYTIFSIRKILRKIVRKIVRKILRKIVRNFIFHFFHDFQVFIFILKIIFFFFFILKIKYKKQDIFQK
jgi:hypothetical protein